MRDGPTRQGEDEWSVGAYEREVTLPVPVNAVCANASYGNGPGLPAQRPDDARTLDARTRGPLTWPAQRECRSSTHLCACTLVSLVSVPEMYPRHWAAFQGCIVVRAAEVNLTRLSQLRPVGEHLRLVAPLTDTRCQLWFSDSGDGSGRFLLCVADD